MCDPVCKIAPSVVITSDFISFHIVDLVEISLSSFYFVPKKESLCPIPSMKKGELFWWRHSRVNSDDKLFHMKDLSACRLSFRKGSNSPTVFACFCNFNFVLIASDLVSFLFVLFFTNLAENFEFVFLIFLSFLKR